MDEEKIKAFLSEYKILCEKHKLEFVAYATAFGGAFIDIEELKSYTGKTTTDAESDYFFLRNGLCEK